MLLLAACAPPSPVAETPREDTAEVLPGVPDRSLDGPAQVALDCEVEIPLEGKTDCTLRVTWPEGDAAYEGHAGVGIHGRSSAGFPKRQFAVELRDADGANAPTDLFGMGTDADWLLNGMYLDRAMFRNKLAYDLYREMGDVAPESAYVELTLDGVYWGVYLLTERIEAGEDRVDIPADDGSGASFIVRADEAGIASRVQYAAWAPVDPDPAPPGVAARIAAFEETLLGDGATLFEDADLDGYVDFVLLEECLKNNDGYFLSHHLYTDPGGRLRFIPWDLDLTLGQPSYNDNELSDRWVLYRPDLIARPALQSAFRRRLPERWAELRLGPMSDEALLSRLEGYRRFLGEAVGRNWQAWDIAQVPNVGFPLYAVASADEEYAHVEAWLVDRLAWVDANVATY